MKLMATLFFSVLLSSCYGHLYQLELQDADSAATVTNKVAQRVGWCVASAWALCASEWLFLPDAIEQRQQDLAYQQRYSMLSAEERHLEATRDLIRTQAAGMILQGVAVHPIVPAPLSAPVPPPTSCTSFVNGAWITTACY